MPAYMPCKHLTYTVAFLAFAGTISCKAEGEKPVWENAPVLMCREIYSTLCFYNGGVNSLSHSCSKVTGHGMWRVDFPNNVVKHFDTNHQETLLHRSSRAELEDRLESVVTLSSARMLRFVQNKDAGRKNVYLAVRFGAFNPPSGLPLAGGTMVSECVPTD